MHFVECAFSQEKLFEAIHPIWPHVNSKRPRGLDVLLELKTQYTRIFLKVLNRMLSQVLDANFPLQYSNRHLDLQCTMVANVVTKFG